MPGAALIEQYHVTQFAQFHEHGKTNAASGHIAGMARTTCQINNRVARIRTGGGKTNIGQLDGARGLAFAAALNAQLGFEDIKQANKLGIDKFNALVKLFEALGRAPEKDS